MKTWKKSYFSPLLGDLSTEQAGMPTCPPKQQRRWKAEGVLKQLTIFFFTFAFTILPFIPTTAQQLDIQWQQCFGGSMLDGAYDIVMVENGYIIAGGTGSNDGDISFSYGNGDGWLVRIDSVGNMLWEKTYGGSDSEAFNRIIPTLDNNFYLVGMSWSSDGDISNDPYPDSPDYWIVKIDSLGNIIWDIIVGGNAGETMWTGAPTDDGGVVAIGQTSSNDGDISVFYGGNDTWIVKISNDGELEWDFTIGTDFIDVGQAVIQTSDGGYLAASNSMLGEGGNITCEPHSYMAEAVLTKLDADRNIEWQHCYGGSDNDGIVTLLEVNDGYIFGAYTHSSDGDVSGFHGESDIWIVKIDFNGNIIWQNSLGGSNWETLDNIIQHTSGEFVSFAITRSNNGDVSGNHSLSEYDHDIWMIKLSSEGELLSQQCIGGAGDEDVNFGVVKKSDYNYVIAGKTDYGPSYDVQCTPHGGNGDEDYWVFEIKDTTVGIQQIYLDNGLKVYPNPANTYVVFETNKNVILNASGGMQGSANEESSQHNPQSPPILTITNTLGQQVYNWK